MKPLQAAERSKAKPPAPSAACTRTAVAGKAWSGVEVASDDGVDLGGVGAGIGQGGARRPRWP